MFCNQWYVNDNARAKNDLDKVQLALDRQHNGLTLQNLDISKENSAISSLIRDQQMMLTHPGYSQTEFEREDEQIKAKQAKVNARLSDYTSATQRYTAASLQYTAASAQFIQLLQSHTHQNILCASILLGGAMIALLVAVMGQASRWHGPMQPA
jgi:hypothetical protein